MMRLAKTITLLAVSLAASGCSLLEFKPLDKETLRNSQGHVIGYRERLCDCSAGEELDRVVLFTPRLTQAGNVIGYEERIKNGVVLWDTRGKRIGSRYVDLRSRGTNARNSGLTIVFRSSAEAARLAVAQVTIEEIKQYLQMSN
jgi:hypothetical protein